MTGSNCDFTPVINGEIDPNFFNTLENFLLSKKGLGVEVLVRLWNQPDEKDGSKLMTMLAWYQRRKDD